MVAVGVGALAIPGPSIAGKMSRTLFYEGVVTGDAAAKVYIEVTKREGSFKEARFRALNLEYRCDDGTSFRDRLNPERFPFVRKRTFYGKVKELEDHRLGVRTTYEAKGHLLEGGDVKGHLKYVYTYASPGFRDCTTGVVRWRASRIQ